MSPIFASVVLYEEVALEATYKVLNKFTFKELSNAKVKTYSIPNRYDTQYIFNVAGPRIALGP